MGKGHISISIPLDTDKDIDKILELKRGYTSKASVVVDGIRHLLRDLKDEEQKEAPA